MSNSDTDSDKDSLEVMNDYDGDYNESPEDSEKIDNVRQAIRDWKLREQDKNTTNISNAKGLHALRNYTSNAAKLSYDLGAYMKTSQNKESNMKDELYVKIINAIGAPGLLSRPLEVLLNRMIERDLIELPFTVEPKVINEYAQKNIRVKTEFPDEQ